MATAATLRNMTDDQLLDEQSSVSQELFNLRFQFATGQADNSAQLGALKRDIARISTILREREIAAAEAMATSPATAVSAAASNESSNKSTEESSNKSTEESTNESTEESTEESTDE